MLDDQAEPLGKRSEHLRRIMARQMRRLERLVDDLAELSRIESGDLSLDLRSVHLRKLVDDVCDDFIEQAAQHRIQLRLSGSGVWISRDYSKDAWHIFRATARRSD